MHILKNTFLYTLLVLFAVGGVFIFSSNEAAAQSCTIDLVQYPSATVGETAGPYTITGSCSGVSEYMSFGLRDRTANDGDGEWIIGPHVQWGSGYMDFGQSGYRTFSETGDHVLEARVEYDGPVEPHPQDCPWCWADTDRQTISVGPPQCSLNSPTISGPANVQLPSGYQDYQITFNHSGDAVDYRLNVVGHWLSGWYSTTASGINWGINWDNHGEGPYQICVTARAKSSGSICSPEETSCMSVNVNEGEGATLRVESFNPSSGVSITGSGNISSGYTTHTVNRNEDLSGTLTAPASASGNNFDRWEGCDSASGRNCTVFVGQDSSQTVRAVYNTPVSIGKATVYVHSSNPSTGVYITGTGNLYNGYASYTIQRDVNLSGYLNAPATVSGNNFDHWQGCDSVSGQQCYVSTAVDSSQTVRAVYATPGVSEVYGCTDSTATNYNSSATTDDGSCTYPASSPQYATLNIRSVNPSTINVGVNNSNNFAGYYWTPETIVRDSYMTGVIWADEVWGDNTFREWQGCDPLSQPLHYRGCYVRVELGETQTVTAFYDLPPAPGCTDPTATNYDSNADTDDGSCTYPSASVNSFSLSDPNINFNATPPELHVDDQPFTLVWSTSNANTVTGASSESTRWPGNKSLSGNQSITERNFKETSKIFNYSITAHGDGGNSSDELTVKLIDPPSFDLSSESETDIEGFPGSQATNDVTVTSRKYDGDVELEVRDADIPSSLKDDEGNTKVSFTFDPDQVDTDGNSVLTIEMTGTVNESISETITITGTDLSGTAEPQVETTQFVLNISGFNPQTIEEF